MTVALRILRTLRALPATPTLSTLAHAATPARRRLLHTTSRLNMLTSLSPHFEPTESYGKPNPNLSPALSAIIARNVKYSDTLAHDKPDLLTTNAAGQAPKVFWIGCSDSRVPESNVCQTEPGEVFTVRNIANQWREGDDSTNAALTFAIEALGVEEVVVVGHTSCGGVSASIAAAAALAADPASASTPPATSLGRYLVPLAQLAAELKQNGTIAPDTPKDEFVRKLTTANVVRQVENLAKSEVIQRNWTTGESTLVPGKKCVKVKIHGWVHDVATAKLHDLNISRAAP